MNTLKFQAVLLLLHVCAISLFTCGFLLTRVELTNKSTCNDFHDIEYHNVCANPPFSKVVLVIVDALRFDFFHSRLEGQLAHQNQLTRLKQLLSDMGPAAMSAKFVADPPTTTMQRLKAMLTGVLPTFVDVGNSFSASAVTEDNLAHQLYAQNRRMVFVGDDTWTQLVPEVFSKAYPYESFNVKDLHTVDNGVWEHVVPLLKSGDEWDVLVAHYLGVDHAGHTHGVNSPQMRDKVQQMDEQLANITEYLVSQAGEGGGHEHTLLIMLSDHGQTMGGDHGGGSDEEVDSFFAAFNLAKAHRWLQQRTEADGDSDVSEPVETAQTEQTNEKCWGVVVPQLDFTASLSVLLGAPIPFGNVGKVSPHIWRVALQDGQLPNDCQAGVFSGWQAGDMEKYVDILMTNAAQIQRYLQAYSKRASLPSAALSHCTQLYDQAVASYNENASKDPEAAAGKLLDYLAAAAEMARRQFTQFNLWLMGVGCALLAVTVVLQLVKTWRSFGGWGPWCWSFDVLAACACIAFHAGAIFSTNLIMSEGRVQCALVVALSSLLLLRSCLATAWKLHPKRTTLLPSATSTLSATATNHPAAHHVHGKVPDGLTPTSAVSHSVTNTGGGERASALSLVAAVGLVATSVALWMYGLIDRTGQDPHDKSEVDATDMQGPQLGWLQQALRVQVPLLLFPALFQATMQSLGKHASAVVRYAPLMVWSQYATIALWWTARLHADWWQASPQDILLNCIERASQLPFSAAMLSVPLLQRLLQHLAAWLLSPHPAPPPTAGVAFPVQFLEHYMSEHLQLPLRLLLPRLVYAACLKWLIGGAFHWLVATLAGANHGHQMQESGAAAGAARRKRSWVSWVFRSSGSGDDDVRECAARRNPGAVAVIATAAVISGPTVIVLGVKGPLVMLLGAIQSAFVMAYLSSSGAVLRELKTNDVTHTVTKADESIRGSTAVQPAGHALSGMSSKDAQHDRTCSPSMQGVEASIKAGVEDTPQQASGLGSSFLVATLCAMHGVQLFFCSGHFCEFSGLQYPSSFVGFDDMHWYRSGLLLLLNTFGPHFLAYLLLPAVAAFTPPTAAAPPTPYIQQVAQANPTVRQPTAKVIHESYTPSSCSRTEDTCEIEEVVSGQPSSVSASISRLQKALSTSRVTCAGDTETTAGSAGDVAALVAVRPGVQNVGWVQYSECLERMMLVAGVVRGLNVLAAVISAGYQRRHLLVWALFAPKFVFEIWLLVMSHVASLVALTIVAAAQ